MLNCVSSMLINPTYWLSFALSCFEISQCKSNYRGAKRMKRQLTTVLVTGLQSTTFHSTCTTYSVHFHCIGTAFAGLLHSFCKIIVLHWQFVSFALPPAPVPVMCNANHCTCITVGTP